LNSSVVRIAKLIGLENLLKDQYKTTVFWCKFSLVDKWRQIR